MEYKDFPVNLVEELNELRPPEIKAFVLITKWDDEALTPPNSIRVVYENDKQVDLVGYTKQLYMRYQSENVGLYDLAKPIVDESLRAYQKIKQIDKQIEEYQSHIPKIEMFSQQLEHALRHKM